MIETVIKQSFEEENATASVKFEDQEFEQGNFISSSLIKNDWRNHVPVDIQKCWGDLTDREQKLIFIITEILADTE